MAFSYRWVKYASGSGYALVREELPVLEMGTYEDGSWGQLSPDESYKGVFGLRFDGTSAKGIRLWCHPVADILYADGTVSPRQNLIELGFDLRGLVVGAGNVVFSREETPGQYDLWLCDEEGGGARRLTSGEADDFSPSWSADGTEVIFVSRRSGVGRVVKALADGTSQEFLTDVDEDVRDAHWCKVTDSLDGAYGRIVYTTNVAGGWQIYVMEADGSGKTRVTNRLTQDYTGDDWGAKLSSDGSKVVFVSDRSGAPQVYRIFVNGTGTTRLTNNSSEDIDPAYGPAGYYSNKIAFASNRSGSFEIYVMDENGGVQSRVTFDGSSKTSPQWSPDGSELYFSVSWSGGPQDVYRVGSDGSGEPERVTTDSGDDSASEVSPDGTRMLYTAEYTGDYRLVRRLDLSVVGPARLTDTGVEDYDPAFSPDGLSTAFTSTVNDGNDNIYSGGATFNSATQQTTGAYVDRSPSFSYDGESVVFASNRTGSFEIYRMVLDSGDPVRLTLNGADDIHPSWQPVASSAKIAFASDRVSTVSPDGEYQVYVMEEDGTGVAALTYSGSNFDPAWSPDGTRIVFTSRRDGRAQIYAMDADGDSQARLHESESNDRDPCYTSDGRYVVFVSDRDSPGGELYAVDVATGLEVYRLTNSSLAKSTPACVPGSTEVAFVGVGASGSRDIYFVDSQGKIERYVRGDDHAYGASWGASGVYLHASVRAGDGTRYAERFRLDGSDVMGLTPSGDTHDYLSVHKVGERLYFQRRPVATSVTGRFGFCDLAGAGDSVDWIVLPDGGDDGEESVLLDALDDTRFLFSVGPGASATLYELSLSSAPNVGDEFDPDTFTQVLDSSGNPIPCLSASYSASGEEALILEPLGGQPNQVYRYRFADGTLTQVTSSADDKHRVAWNPVGTPFVLYVAEVGAVKKLFTCDLSGDDVEQYTDDVALSVSEEYGSWSSDGASVAYQRTVYGNSAATGLYVATGGSHGVKVSGTVTPVISSEHDASAGRVYLAGSYLGSVYSLWHVPAGGGAQPTRISNWSPQDFAVIPGENAGDFYFSGYDAEDPSDAVLKLRFSSDFGQSRVRMTDLDNSVEEANPWYSPELSKVVFVAGGRVATVPFDAVAGSVTYLTASNDDSYPAYSPDGTKIAFVRNRQVWVMSASGGSPTALTSGLEVRSPSFTSDSTGIVFENMQNGRLCRVPSAGGDVEVLPVSGSYPRMHGSSDRVSYSKVSGASEKLYYFVFDTSTEESATSNTADDVYPCYSSITGDVIFASNRDTNYQLWRMDPDGSGEVQVRSSAYNETDPSYSNDGTQIAFSSDQHGQRDIFSCPYAGSPATRLTTSSAPDYQPCWSLDDSRIFFVSERAGQPHIYRMNADGTSQTKLTTGSSSNMFPRISPDGSSVLFVSNRTGKWKAYTMTTSGGSVALVDTGDREVFEAGWNSSGTRIVCVGGDHAERGVFVIEYPGGAFVGDVVGDDGDVRGAVYSESNDRIIFASPYRGDYELYSTPADPSTLYTVTPATAASETLPAWSHDERSVAYVSDSDGDFSHIFKVDVSSGAISRLTSTSADDMNPSWEPTDSSPRIAFQSNRVTGTNPDGNWQIWTMDEDGGSQNQETVGGHNHIDPCWHTDDDTVIVASSDSGSYKLHKLILGVEESDLTSEDTTGSGNDVQPNCSPDGSTVAFVSDQTGVGQVYLLDFETLEVTRLTKNGIPCSTPSFTPDGDYVVYCREYNDGSKSLWRIAVDGSSDELVYVAGDLDSVQPDCARGVGSAQLSDEPSTWPQMPTTQSSALSAGRAMVNRANIAFSKKMAIAIKVPDDHADARVRGLRLHSSFQPM